MRAGFWPHGDPSRVARAIVADPRFGARTSAAPPEPTLWDRVMTWIGERLRDLFTAVGHVLGAKNPLNVAVGVLVIVLVAGLLGYLIFRLAGRAAAARAAARELAPQRRLDVPAGAAELRAAAAAAARAGRYRDAAALLFAAAVRALAEGGRVAYDPARTPGEYRRLVRDPLFDGLANDAVLALFGPAEPHADAFARMERSYERFFGGAPR